MKKSLIICGLLLLCIYVNAQHTFYRTEYKHFSDALLMEANQGNAMALNDLGSCYDRADGVPQDRQKAFECFQKASDKGWFLAHFNLAQYYYKGFACEQNYEKAVELLIKTLEKDSKFAPAQWHLAECYYNGLGTAKDMAKALDLYKECEIAKHPNLEILYLKIAGIYEKGIDGTPDYGNAFQYWMELAEKGEKNKAVGEYKVGEYYDFGRGVERNKLEAISWYTKAANKGHGLAQYKVGMCMYYGETISQNYKEAIRYFELALKDLYLLNNVRGEIMRKLSACYRFGRGVSVDVEKADYYMKEAARYGDADVLNLQEYLQTK